MIRNQVQLGISRDNGICRSQYMNVTYGFYFSSRKKQDQQYKCWRCQGDISPSPRIEPVPGDYNSEASE